MEATAEPPSMLDRAKGCMAGLALGDAIGRPVEGMSARQIQEEWGAIAGFVVDEPAGSDDTEYALLTAETLYRCGVGATRNDFAETWRREVLVQTSEFKGAGFSEMAAIENLRKGLEPPESGDHIHGWSDGLAMRVAPIGIVTAGNPAAARLLALEDGVVSHSGEGLHAGVAVAVAVSAAMAGASAREAFETALISIPNDSWTSRNLLLARELVDANMPEAELAVALHERLAVTEYYWADLAPEAVALAFAALLHGQGRFVDSMLFAVNLGRDADTNAAIAGCISGAITGIAAFPLDWVSGLRPVAGSCIWSMAGRDVVTAAERLMALHGEGN